MPLSSLSPSVFAIAEGDKAIIGTSTYINLLICTVSRLDYDPLGSVVFKFYAGPA